MATIEELANRVQRNLSAISANNVFDGSKDIDLIVDGIASAYDAILPWTPKLAQETISSGTLVHPLPSDLYAVEAVKDAEASKIIPRLQLEPGEILEPQYWIEFPTGSITFNKELENDCTLFYLAYWDKPAEEGDLEGDFEPPAFCITPMSYFATAYVLLPDSVQSSEIRQFNVKADSGNPEDNPIEKSVKFLIRMFEQGMDAHPSHQKARI